MSNMCEKCGRDKWTYSDMTLTDGQLWCFWCVKVATVKMYKESPVCPYCCGLSISHKEDCQLIKLLEFNGGMQEVYDGYEYRTIR